MRLLQVGVSQLPPRGAKSPDKPVDTPWHAHGKVDLTLELSFEYEFDWYWFNQLGHIFGVRNDQVEQLAREIAVHQLRVPPGDEYRPDPRLDQWNSGGYYERETYHTHGSYPRTDTYRFYYSYHSFLCVASKLLQHLPVVRCRDYQFDTDEWIGWLRRHSITRGDGRWLADRRDPAPIRRRAWVNGFEKKHWRWSIQRDDFVDVVVSHGASPGFLCVNGDWTDCVDSYVEHLIVGSALVNREAAESLANSMRSRPDPNHFMLPSYGDHDREFQIPPFELIGWITTRSGSDHRLDQFDPHANEIRYPPEEVGETFSSILGLSTDHERRTWSSQNAVTPRVINEIWSNKQSARQDWPYRFGERMSASLDLLKQLCTISEKDLIFCVEIDRKLHRHYRSQRGEDDVYTPRSFKVLIFSSNGILRDAEKSYQLG
jgi:hypothetical protein